MGERHQSTFSVPADHPSLPGHFPGSPVVPGVVVLDLVLKTSELWRQRAMNVTGLRQVKFHAPLLPQERADVTLELEGDALAFRVTRGEQIIAAGTFVIERVAGS
jgi:3-hydroxymyristoyl/3-hydroxydecanoyl-(acyl carrier protein) dehydratase